MISSTKLSSDELKKAMICIEFLASNKLYNLFWQEYALHSKDLLNSKYKVRLQQIFKEAFVNLNKRSM